MDLGRATLKLVLSRTGSAMVFFTGITLFARLLPADEYGVFFLFLALLGVLSIFADFGMRGALEKRLSEGAEPDRVLGSAFVFKLATVSVVVAVVVVAAPAIDAYAGASVAPYLAVAIVVQEFSRFYVHAVRGELRVGETAPLEVVRRLTWLGTGLVLVAAGFGVEGVLLGTILGRAVELVWGVWLCETSLGRPSPAAVRSLFAFSKYQTVIAVGGRVYQWLDVLVIGFFLANRFVSAYEIAWQVTLLVLLVSKSLELSLFPQLSDWDASGETAQIRETITTALGYAMVVSVPAVVGAWLYAAEILQLVFGPGYAIGAAVMVILMVEKLFQSFNGVINAALRGIDKPALSARVTVVTVAVNLALSVALVTTVGFVGVAVATAASWLINVSLRTRYLSRFVTVEIPYRLLGWYALCSLAMGGVLLAFRQLVPVVGLPSLFLHVALGGATYVSLLASVPDIRRRIIFPSVRVIKG